MYKDGKFDLEKLISQADVTSSSWTQIFDQPMNSLTEPATFVVSKSPIRV